MLIKLLQYAIHSLTDFLPLKDFHNTRSPIKRKDIIKFQHEGILRTREIIKNKINDCSLISVLN